MISQCHGAVRYSKSWMALDQRSARSQALMPLFTLGFWGNLSDWVNILFDVVNLQKNIGNNEWW